MRDTTPTANRSTENLGPLAALSRLEELELSFCPNIEDIEPLSGLVRLREFSLWDSTGVADLRPLSGMTQLRKLMLNGCRRVRDLSPLGDLRSLEMLYLSDCPQLTLPMLAPLVDLPSLRSVSIGRPGFIPFNHPLCRKGVRIS